MPRSAQARWRSPPRGWAHLWDALCRAYDVLGFDDATLYFETHQGDGFREPGLSKTGACEPQITIGLLTDATGFPLMLQAFEGNKAECDTRSYPLSGSR